MRIVQGISFLSLLLASCGTKDLPSRFQKAQVQGSEDCTFGTVVENDHLKSTCLVNSQAFESSGIIVQGQNIVQQTRMIADGFGNALALWAEVSDVKAVAVSFFTARFSNGQWEAKRAVTFLGGPSRKLIDAVALGANSYLLIFSRTSSSDADRKDFISLQGDGTQWSETEIPEAFELNHGFFASNTHVLSNIEGSAYFARSVSYEEKETYRKSADRDDRLEVSYFDVSKGWSPTEIVVKGPAIYDEEYDLEVNNRLHITYEQEDSEGDAKIFHTYRQEALWSKPTELKVPRSTAISSLFALEDGVTGLVSFSTAGDYPYMHTLSLFDLKGKILRQVSIGKIRTAQCVYNQKPGEVICLWRNQEIKGYIGKSSTQQPELKPLHFYTSSNESWTSKLLTRPSSTPFAVMTEGNIRPGFPERTKVVINQTPLTSGSSGVTLLEDDDILFLEIARTDREMISVALSRTKGIYVSTASEEVQKSFVELENTEEINAYNEFWVPRKMDRLSGSDSYGNIFLFVPISSKRVLPNDEIEWDTSVRAVALLAQ